MTLWQRYFVTKTLKTTLFFLLAFFGLYTIIDYSTHASAFRHAQAEFFILYVLKHYVFVFIDNLPILLPFALLIGTINTVSTLNTQNELVALLASGIPLKKLLRPFLWIGLAGTLILYVSEEFLEPQAQNQLKNLREGRRQVERQKKDLPTTHHLQMEDGTHFIYRHYDGAENIFQEVYWIVSFDTIYYMQALRPSPIPEGYFVDLLERHDELLAVKTSQASQTFPEMKFSQKLLQETLLSPEELSPTQLLQKSTSLNNVQSEKETRLLANFYYKMAIPWLCLFAVLGPLPYCVRFSRTLPVFLIYAVSMAALISIYLIFDAGLILGERQVLAPLLAIGVPFVCFFSLFVYNYIKIK